MKFYDFFFIITIFSLCARIFKRPVLEEEEEEEEEEVVVVVVVRAGENASSVCK